jgi:serine/threonine-protein kinase
MRAASLVLFTGFSTFLVKNSFSLDRFDTSPERALLWAHVAVTALTAVVASRLCRSCRVSLRKLRVAELLVFGGSALFFLLLQRVMCQASIEQDVLPQTSPPWLLLMFTYALFIPNRWPRAAMVLGAMAAAPAILTAYLAWNMPAFAEILSSHADLYGNYVLEMTMVMTFGFLAATYGVYTIGSLRTEVFEAKQLGQYRLKSQLGSGGMGEVYLAEHQLLKRPCAIKVIRPEKAGDAKMLARFEREVRATAKLSHWNTVEIFDYGRSEDGTFYYVMEYLPGLNLGQLVERYGPLPAERVIYLMLQTCDALAEAHGHGLVHRDIKPGNIFAAYRGGIHDVAKLLDFGLAKPVADAQSAALTIEGSITGSPLYMSPEQVTGERQLDARSDIYSLGAVMYYLLTAQPPFGGDRPIKVMIAHAHEDVLPPSHLRDDVPEDLEAVVLRCLAKQPESRYGSAEELRDALASCRAARGWNRDSAACWWKNYGCPKKRAFDEAAIAAAG